MGLERLRKSPEDSSLSQPFPLPLPFSPDLPYVFHSASFSELIRLVHASF
jgi:hypothetical protein